MPKRVAIGVVTSDGASKTRRVELPRLVQHAKYSKLIHRRTVCHVHDEQNESKVGDTVEIKECPPRSKLKRWELVRVVRRSQAVDLEALRAAHKKRGHDARQAEAAAAAAIET
ncbi:MAG: 30S ribosomal protein S17 [Planctomycetes bacterium]|nr:30S ribosomal protein S17 [Planctomycetota bacterium]